MSEDAAKTRFRRSSPVAWTTATRYITDNLYQRLLSAHNATVTLMTRHEHITPVLREMPVRRRQACHAHVQCTAWPGTVISVRWMSASVWHQSLITVIQHVHACHVVNSSVWQFIHCETRCQLRCVCSTIIMFKATLNNRLHVERSDCF